ncbi:hypothetical protein PVAND_017051 [Polypedilum vanderplanki]|uniref:Uncharacterized protein n=1 Tax=Polypedilum vanderplanki TaxID=319348 RepID=A0A9J6BH37_POLVA|nr:hypothetical protein PVAND_017051 [Polypedilum vanderplanki]
MLKIFFTLLNLIYLTSSISQECYNFFNNFSHPFHCCNFPIADTQSTTSDHCYHACFRDPDICCLYDCMFREMQYFNNGQFTVEERLKYYTVDIENKKFSKKLWQPIVEKTLETCEKRIAVKLENNEKCKMPEFMYMMFACEQYENFMNCPTFENTTHCLELKEYVKEPKSCSLSYGGKKYPQHELWFVDEIYEEGDNFDCIIWQLW